MAGKFNQRIVAISVLSILVLAAATAALIVSRIKLISRPLELTLPDGTTVRIEALTFGKEHSYSTDPVRDKLRRWLPKPCQCFLGKASVRMKMQTVPDSLVIWMTRLDPLSGSVYPQQEWHHTTDRHGCKFRSNYRTSSNVAGGVVMGAAFDNFPRGDETFDYIIADRDGKTLGRFTLANPNKVAPKRWVPEELPITKTNGELVVQLRRLARVYSENSQMPFDPEIEVLRPSEAKFVPGGKFWEKPLIQAFDSLGNCCPGSFCTNEHLWKIEANFFRTRASQFRPEEIWSITNVAIPQIDGVTRLQRTNTIQGAPVALLTLQGSQYGQTSGPRPQVIPAVALTLTIWTRQRYGDLRVYVRARDDAARDLITRARPQFGTDLRLFGEGQQQFEIQPLPDSQLLNIEVIVQKPVRFEFFTDKKPQLAPTW